MELDVKTEAYKLIKETPLSPQTNDLMGYAELRQIEDTISLIEMAINDVLVSDESILFYNDVLHEIIIKYELALKTIPSYKSKIKWP